MYEILDRKTYNKVKNVNQSNDAVEFNLDLFTTRKSLISRQADHNKEAGLKKSVTLLAYLLRNVA